MSKEMLKNLIELVPENDIEAENLSPKSWDDIKEVPPDEWGLKMLDEMDVY